MRIRTRSIAIMLSSVTTQAVTILCGVVLVRLVSKGFVGTYRQATLVMTFLTGLLGLNLPASLFFFIPRLGGDQRRLFMTQTLALSVLMAAATASAMLFGAAYIGRLFDNPDLPPLLRIFSLYPLAHLVLNLVPAFMISLDRPVRAGLYTLSGDGIRAAVVLGMAWLGYPLHAILWGLVLLTLSLAAVSAADTYRLTSGRFFRFDRKLLASQLGYVVPIFAATVVGVVNRRFDGLLISSFFDPEKYAVYSCGAFELPVIGIVTTSVFSAIMPDLVVLWDGGRKGEVLGLFHTAVRKCSLVIYPCFALALVCAVDLIVLLYGGAYREAAWPFIVYLFALPVRVAVYGSVIRAAGRTRPIAVGAVIAVVTNVLISLALVLLGRALYGAGSRLSFLGPSIGTILALVASCAYLIWQIRRATQAPIRSVMPWKELGGIMAVCLLSAGAVALLPLGPLPLLARLLVRGAAFAAVLLGVSLATGILQQDEKDMLAYPWRAGQRLLRRAGGRRET
jgi:O-antigen/teichoic acid export membrane protein